MHLSEAAVRRWAVSVRSVLLGVLAALALVVANAPAAHAAGASYVALGDSYSSGVGAGDYTDESGDCDRSPNAYPALWAADNAPAAFVSVACSGATTADVANSQLSALSGSTTLVSITVGGNDENFAGIMEDCNLYSDDTCVSEIQAAEDDAQANLPGKFGALYGAIRSDAPNARVVVLDYPDFYDLANDCVGLSQTKRAKIDEGINLLDSITGDAANAAGFSFADVRGAFSGHEICDDNRWLHSVNFADFGESYHPTADGHAQAYYPTFGAYAG
jgi:lysophospholipase L1-like esterase